MSTEFASADLTAGQLNAIVKKLGGHEEALKFLRGETMVVPVVSTTPAPEPVIDPMIHVDRTVRPAYPTWVKVVMHTELEIFGPAEYSVESVQLWLHDDQKSTAVNGNRIYAKLKEGGLDSCLGLHDLQEIQKKGTAFFRKQFKGKAIVAWKSVVQDDSGGLMVPFLYEYGDEVFLHWRCVDGFFNSHNPAARLAS